MFKPSLLTLTSVLAVVAAAQLEPAGHGAEVIPSPSLTKNQAYLVKAHNGAVASENKLCSDIGVDVLKHDGNAVDAAIATALCSGVVNMFSSGIGGGGFLTVRLKPGQVYTVDFRERAPAASNATMFNANPQSSVIGGLAVGVPGEVKGLFEAHKRWGKLPWKRLVQPAVELAKGWKVDRELNRRVLSFETLLTTNPDWKPIFAPNGTLLLEGDTISRVNLSRTLDLIARQGADAFYKGPVAKALAAKIQATGGILTEDDLASYSVKVKKALQGTYRGQKVYSTHAPGSGAVLIHMLNVLERYDLKTLSPVNLHRIVEVEKFGYAARTRIADPDFQNSTSLIDEIPTKRFADIVAKNLTDNSTHPSEYYNPIVAPEDHGTMNLVVVDKNRMAVSLTSTVNYVFGSQVLDPVTGVILNNELDDFSKPGIPNSAGLFPSPFNFPAPGKRPLSSTVPSIIEYPDGSFKFATGAAGSTRIFTAVLQTIIGALDRGLNVSGAIEQPRTHHFLYPNVVDIDSGFSQEQLDGLTSRGHNISVHDINQITSSVTAISSAKGALWAASDARKNGVAAGY